MSRESEFYEELLFISDERHVAKGAVSGKWYYIDEIEQLSRQYDTEAEAIKGLTDYCYWLENGDTK